MALIKCVDCGKEVSDRAKVCPNCGCPIECSVSETHAEENVLINNVENRDSENSTISNEDISSYGNGGMCLNCEICSFPHCSFGK